MEIGGVGGFSLGSALATSAFLKPSIVGRGRGKLGSYEQGNAIPASTTPKTQERNDSPKRKL